MKHAYYLAEKDILSGDTDIGGDLKERFLSYGVPKPQRYDGISRVIHDDGKVVITLIIRNFFVEKLEHCVIRTEEKPHE